MPNSFITNFTVGPSKLYTGVADFLSAKLQEGLGELSHRSGDFTEMSKKTQENMRHFFNIPKGYHIYYTYSATEGMEILTRNSISQKACHVSNGNFGNVWKKTSLLAKKQVQFISYNGEKRVEPNEILPETDVDFLALTANETATGIAYSPKEISEIRKKYPDILIGIDATSSMGAVEYDFSQADAWLFSVQKAFGLPAGLGLLVVGPRIVQKSQQREQSGEDVGCHHSLSGLEKKMAGKFQTPTTPNALNICGLGFVCEQFSKDFGSFSSLYRKTQEKANVLYTFFDAHPTLSVNTSPQGRSESIIVVNGDEKELEDLHSHLSQQGITIGKGYGKAKSKQIRIANFPVHSLPDIQHLLRNIPLQGNYS
jgi:phosphoserine aminotransferase